MKLISWNVNGFRAILGKGFADIFEGFGADVVCLQETKMQPGQAEFSPPGYHQYWYSAEKDITFFEGLAETYIAVKPGMFAIFFPQDGHAPGISPDGVKKVIVKVKA